MIDVRDLTYSYPPLIPGGARLLALDRVSFRVEKGQCLAVAGPNNSGKTTLCLAAAGLAPRITEGRITGQVLVAGRDVQMEKPGTLADQLGLVMQEPAGQMFNRSVEHEIAWGLENLGVPPSEMDERIDWALAMVGLEYLPRDQSPLSLSGGEQKRLALASALVLKPRVLILDEPAGGLSPLGQREMIAILTHLRREEDLTVLMTETNPDFISALADQVLILVGGRIVKQGAPSEIYAGLDSIHNLGIVLPPSLIFARALPDVDQTTLSVAQAAELASQYPAPTNMAQPQVPFMPPLSDSSAAIRLEQISFAYAPTRPILRNITLQIAAGEFVVLTGDNGAGKTTLVRHLIGLLRPDAGTVSILGHDIARMSIGQVARQVGFAYQNPELQIFNPTVREEIAFGPSNLGLSADKIKEAVEEALARFDLTRVGDAPPSVLSFSRRRMVALASIAAMQTPILVLDEPTVGLDAAGQATVMDWLASAHGTGVTVLVITHDMELAARYAQRIIVLEGGRIAADGPPAQVFSQADILASAGLEAPFTVQLGQYLGDPSLAAVLTPEAAAGVLMARS